MMRPGSASTRPAERTANSSWERKPMAKNPSAPQPCESRATMRTDGLSSFKRRHLHEDLFERRAPLSEREHVDAGVDERLQQHAVLLARAGEFDRGLRAVDAHRL